MKHRPLYNWIAEVARLIPAAKFTPPKITYRDGKTRIRVVVHEEDQNFVISNHAGSPPATPQDVVEHFDRDTKLHRPMTDDSCCTNERRSFAGGCMNCGDPCL